MVTITIAADSREIHNRRDIDEAWINGQINGRRRDGSNPCVRIAIRCDDVNIDLATSGCPGGSGGSRRPNAHEDEVLTLWKERGLSNPQFASGNVIAFLKQLPCLSN